jgi:hypothetical protein
VRRLALLKFSEIPRVWLGKTALPRRKSSDSLIASEGMQIYVFIYVFMYVCMYVCLYICCVCMQESISVTSVLMTSPLEAQRNYLWMNEWIYKCGINAMTWGLTFGLFMFPYCMRMNANIDSIDMSGLSPQQQYFSSVSSAATMRSGQYWGWTIRSRWGTMCWRQQL